MAVAILTADKTKTPGPLRSWAVDLLNKNSPIKFGDDVVAQLKAGDIELPGGMAALISSQGNSGGMAVSPDGKLLAVAKDSSIIIWDLISGAQRTSLLGHSAPVTTVAFSPDGRILASGSSDTTARIWDVDSGRELRGLFGSKEGIEGLAFSPDGNLVTRASDGTISYWHLANGALMRKIRLQNTSN